MKKLKPFRFQLFQILSYRSLRGLAPEPPVSLATPRGQGSPLRFDTQPTGWSVGSAARHQGGIRKDCSASLLNLYKASPLTPFRFPERPAVHGLASVPGEQAGKVQRCRFWPTSPKELPGESQAVQGLANVPGRRAGKVRQCRFRPSFPESRRGKSGVAWFGQSPRRAARRKSGVADFGQNPRRTGGESQAVQVLTNICRDSRRVFEKVKTLQVSTFSNTLLPFFTGASPRTPSLTCDAARAGVAASL